MVMLHVDWLNKFLLNMWPYLDKAICATIKTTRQPIFAEYVGKYKIQAIEFEHLSLGTLPPIVQSQCLIMVYVKRLLFSLQIIACFYLFLFAEFIYFLFTPIHIGFVHLLES
ncbi:synaptotagmin-3-like [Mercurialis annua]|uniref:synaptotagmin-3-like n=1 Tax=Mercurialis annua TaxID=3986 RepID=UPI00215F89C9|nr:synaptotagmin-3-like [Mercurialis annua]